MSCVLLSRTSNAVKNMKSEKVSNGVGLGGGGKICTHAYHSIHVQKYTWLRKHLSTYFCC